MKNYLLMFFILASGMVFSQKKEALKLNRAQFTKANLLSELIKYDIKNTSFLSYQVLAKTHGKLSSMSGNGDSLSVTLKNFLMTADIGSKVYIDIKTKPKSGKPITQSFGILVIE